MRRMIGRRIVEVPDPHETVHIRAADILAFKRMLLLLKVQFDAGEISNQYSPNKEASYLLFRLCKDLEVE